ncbi:peptidoglycan-binding protein [Dyella sp.]|uniref:peptidoglycan-binding protein n=1 Tax=Dyella sp. TaxID=1869338 RepID=UPI002ED14F63
MNYIVKQGDHLAKIAAQFGFADWNTIWNHPDNAALKQQRKNPHILYPGDQLSIPDKQTKDESRAVDQRHKFSLKRNPLKLIVVLERAYQKPLAHVSFDLSIDGDTQAISSDGSGKLQHGISAKAEILQLIARDSNTAMDHVMVPLRIGELDPIDEVSGQRERLNNLGYGASLPDDATPAEQDRAFKSAIEEFQCENKLTVDGICGPQTQAKLKSIHGC